MNESHSHRLECDEEAFQAKLASADCVDSKDMLAELLERDRKKVLNFLVLKGNDIEIVEEAFQEVALAFLKRYSHIERRRFTSYLQGSVANKLIDFKRSKGRKGEYSHQSIDTALYPHEDTRATNPSIAAQKKEEAEMLRGALESLREDRREMLEMRFLEGLTDREIGTKLSLKKSTAYGRIVYAESKIRELLLSQYTDYFS